MISLRCKKKCSARRSIKHMKGDRNDFDALKSSLSRSGFDVVYDINGREADQVAPILDALPNIEQYIYCSSAGVYLKSPMMPHRCVELATKGFDQQHATVGP